MSRLVIGPKSLFPCPHSWSNKGITFAERILTMLVNVILAFLFLFAIFRGWSRGIVAQLVHLGGSLLLFFIAWWYNKPVGEWLSGLWTKSHPESTAFAGAAGNVIAFYLIMTIGGLIIWWITRRTRWFTKFPVVHQINALLGALLTLVITIIFVTLTLAVLSRWPNNDLQLAILNSSWAQWLLTQSQIVWRDVLAWLFHVSANDLTMAFALLP